MSRYGANPFLPIGISTLGMMGKFYQILKTCTISERPLKSSIFPDTGFGCKTFLSWLWFSYPRKAQGKTSRSLQQRPSGNPPLPSKKFPDPMTLASSAKIPITLRFITIPSRAPMSQRKTSFTEIEVKSITTKTSPFTVKSFLVLYPQPSPIEY